MTDPKDPASRDGVEDQHLRSAGEFLDALSPRSDPWASEPSAWIYRGQADAEWELKAKAVRDPDAFAKYGVRVASIRPGYVPGAVPVWRERIGFQERLLTRFRTGLDQSGLVIPSRAPRVSSREPEERNSNVRDPLWEGLPLRETLPLIALAQHHGLPTILLDWTRRSWIAAYFAAVEAAEPEKRGRATHLAVWALRRGGLDQPTEGPYFYEAPGGTNPNLSAQSGLFTMLRVDDGDDLSLEGHFVRLRKITGGALPLQRLTLPVSEAGQLLRFLSYEGITGASMFPGADGVVRAMRETALWDAA